MTFSQLFKDSYIIRGAVVLIVTVAVLYLYIVHDPVPQELYTVWIALIGYMFGILNEKALNTPVPQATLPRGD